MTKFVMFYIYFCDVVILLSSQMETLAEGQMVDEVGRLKENDRFFKKKNQNKRAKIY